MYNKSYHTRAIISAHTHTQPAISIEVRACVCREIAFRYAYQSFVILLVHSLIYIFLLVFLMHVRVLFYIGGWCWPWPLTQYLFHSSDTSIVSRTQKTHHTRAHTCITITYAKYPCRLAQETNVGEDCLGRTLAIAKVHRASGVALAALVQSHQQLQHIVATGHAEVALIRLVAERVCGFSTKLLVVNVLDRNRHNSYLRMVAGVLSLVRIAPRIAARSLLAGRRQNVGQLEQLRRRVRLVLHVDQRHRLAVSGVLRGGSMRFNSVVYNC